MLKADIRIAVPSDEEELVSLLREMHTEAGFGEFSEPKARVAIEVGLRCEMAMIGVIRGKREIEGSIGLFITQPQFSASACLMDMWQYVRPVYRKSQRAKMLISFAKMVSEELNKPLMVAAVSNEQTARKVELLERQLPRAGSLFLYTPQAA